MTARILLVDDDPVQRRLLEAAVTRFGYAAVIATDGQAALTVLDGPDGKGISALVLDLNMPGLDGIGVLKAMAERGLELPVIVQTAQGGIETVVNAMRHGAFDFVVKPASPERLKVALANALRVETRGDEAKRVARRATGTLGFSDIVTRSPTMDKMLRLARKAAASNIPILIEGESGVGKEMVARAIQGSGERAGKPFVTVNCGAIPDNLVESILFGHEKGSFTGATEKHAGKFVEANGGTLFLDEIGDLPLDVQVKLLRSVQEGEVDPVGGRSAIKVDIRLISATHRDLLQRVKDSLFREDLFYRLNVYPIVVPPLRDRREDIEPLTRHFLARFSATETKGRVRAVSPRALAMLEAYDWPGNIRQLENAVFRATVLCDGDTLTEEEFPQIRAQVEGTVDLDAAADRGPEAPRDPQPDLFEAATAEPAAPAAMMLPATGMLRALDDSGEVRPLAEVEYDMIVMAIDHYSGQMSEVARRLGIGRSTLYRKLKEYGIDPETGRSDRLAS
ncbi:sigma-54 dependent transcriptional regulator [Mesorhizobium sp. LHD-90]|uniref:sigma-54-dependent transcriptional regulator n=1 Tax=Mesorhizobium sp. LHD-90 TaxID=3071414 RepID=UPI0027DECA87|nr:sigma-54 dependent transcriptional regulator [Mesorhizobium sp. LHD-90]MDQ6433677.1 sigma-54 dependent transcriptional regulator [Mesorhizobium sp. LHD-90]